MYYDDELEKNTVSSSIVMAIKKELVNTDYRTKYERQFGLNFNHPIPAQKLEERIKDALGDLILKLGFSPSYANDFWMAEEDYPSILKNYDNYYILEYTVVYNEKFEESEDIFFQYFLNKYGEYGDEPISLVDDDLLLISCGFNYP